MSLEPQAPPQPIAPGVQAELDRRFDYVRPDQAVQDQCAAFRARVKELAEYAVTEMPPGRELSKTLDRLEEVLAAGIAALVREPQPCGYAPR